MDGYGTSDPLSSDGARPDAAEEIVYRLALRTSGSGSDGYRRTAAHTVCCVAPACYHTKHLVCLIAHTYLTRLVHIDDGLLT